MFREEGVTSWFLNTAFKLWTIYHDKKTEETRIFTLGLHCLCKRYCIFNYRFLWFQFATYKDMEKSLILRWYQDRFYTLEIWAWICKHKSAKLILRAGLGWNCCDKEFNPEIFEIWIYVLVTLWGFRKIVFSFALFENRHFLFQNICERNFWMWEVPSHYPRDC